MYSQGLHSQILMIGGGGGGGVGPTEVHILYPNKLQLQNCLPKKITNFLADPKKSLSPFFATQKNPGVFHRPKKISFGQNFRPKKITQTLPPLPSSLKYLKGVPEHVFHQSELKPSNLHNLLYTYSLSVYM